MQKCSNALDSESGSENKCNISRFSYTRSLSMAHMEFCLNDLSVILGQMSSNTFFASNLCRKEIEHWGWSQCVIFAETHRLICNMAHWGHHMISRDLDLRSNFNLDLLSSKCISFDERDASRREKYDDNRFSPRLFCLKVLREKRFFCKKNILISFYLKILICWSRINSNGVHAKEQFNSYRVFPRAPTYM